MSNSHRFPVRLAFYLYIVRKTFHYSVSASALQTKCHSTMADSPSPPPTRCLSRLASSLTPPLALSSLPLAAPLAGPSSFSHPPPAEPLLRPSRGSRCTPHSPPWATPPPWTPSRGAWCSRMSTLPTFLPHPAHFSNLSVHFPRLYMRREQREISVRSDLQSQNGTSIQLVNFRNRFIGGANCSARTWSLLISAVSDNTPISKLMPLFFPDICILFVYLRSQYALF